MRWSLFRSRANVSEPIRPFSGSVRTSGSTTRTGSVGSRSSSIGRASARESNRSSAHGLEKSRNCQVPNLYELAKPLLDGAAASGFSVAERQNVLRAISDLLDIHPESSQYWSGPDTPLIAAVQSGCLDVVHLLLRAGANINDRDSKGSSALHKAAFHGSVDLCRKLLEAQADVDACDRQGQTPLFLSASIDVCQLLVASRADSSRVNRDGMSALHVLALTGAADTFRWLSSKMTKVALELRDSDGASASDYARQTGILVDVSPKQASRSSAANHSRVRSSNHDSSFEPHDAVTEAAPQQRIIRRKSSTKGSQRKISKARPVKRGTRTVLEDAETLNKIPKDIFALARPLMTDDSVGEEERECILNSIKDLLRNEPDSLKSWQGPSPPLHSSVESGCADLALVLLQARADVNEVGLEGNRPLHIAVSSGNAEVCAVLLLAGADVNAVDGNGLKPVSFARDANVRKLFTGTSDQSSPDSVDQHVPVGRSVVGETSPDALASMSTQASDPLLEMQGRNVHRQREKKTRAGWTSASSRASELLADCSWQSDDEDPHCQNYRRTGREGSQNSMSRPSSCARELSGQRKTTNGGAPEIPSQSSSMRASSRGRRVDGNRSTKEAPVAYELSQNSGIRVPNRGRRPDASKGSMEELLWARESSPNASKRAASLGRNTREKSSEQSAVVDLYELARPMLDPTSNIAEQQQALLSVKQLLTARPEAIKAWRGPDTPLHAAVKAGRSDLAALFFEVGANANEQDVEGVSMLHHAAFDGNLALCNAILAARADVDMPDCHGQTPLFFAPTSNMCKVLLGKRADVNTQNHAGQSAMHIAGLAGLREVFFCLSSFADGNLRDLRDLNGSTALDYARKSGIGEHYDDVNMGVGQSSSSTAPAPSTSAPSAFGSSGSGFGCNRGRSSKSQSSIRCLSAASSRSHRSRCDLFEDDGTGGPMTALRSIAHDDTQPPLLALPFSPYIEGRAASATPSFGSAATRSSSREKSRDVERRRPPQFATQSDLYEVAKPLLDRQGKALEQQRAMSAVRHLLRSGLAEVAWHGPGTPLSTAIEAGNIEFVNQLVRAHADPNECNSKGTTMLHLASASASSGAAICRALLASKADVNARDCEGQTPIFFAPSCAVCEALVERSADTTSRDQSGRTALHRAASAGLRDVFAWLQGRASEAMRSLRDSSGLTASDYAERAGVLPTGKPERERVSTTGNARNNVRRASAKRAVRVDLRGKSLPSAVAPSGGSSASRAPAEVGRQKSSGSRQPSGQQSLLDLHQLWRQAVDENTSSDKQQRAWRSIQRYVSSDRADLEFWSGPGTPLMAAVQAKSQLFATLLLQARACVNTCNADGSSPLHLAGSTEMIKALLKAKADINARDRRGQTPLFSVPSADLCRLMLERRADIASLNDDGQSALHLAARGGLHDVFVLLSSKADKNLSELKDSNGMVACEYADQAGIPVHGSVFTGSTRSSEDSSAIREGTAPRNQGRQHGSREEPGDEAGWHPAMSRLLRTHDQLLRDLASDGRHCDS